jgi:hypothetical protein
MAHLRQLGFLVLVLGTASGCSVRGLALSKDSFPGTIRYAAVRNDAVAAYDSAPSPSDSKSDKEDTTR